jgi:hypothetical protein
MPARALSQIKNDCEPAETVIRQLLPGIKILAG